MKKTILAKIQLVHSYVTNFSISINDKIENEHQVELEGQVEFKILDITCIEDKCCAVIELGNSIELKNIGKTIGNIDIIMRGFFEGYNCNSKEEFEEMLKLNGATTLSHLIRSYIYTVTGLSGITNIVTPMVDYTKLLDI